MGMSLMESSESFKRTRVREILDAGAESGDDSNEIVGRTVTVKGWVRTFRDQKRFAFVNVNDGSNLSGIQVVVDASNDSYHTVVKELNTGSAVSVVGKVVSSPGAGQNVEIQAESLVLIGEAPADSYPLQKKRHSLEYLRGIAHLRPRTNSIGAVTRVRSALAWAIHEFFQTKSFKYVHTPLITASDCEGAGEMFRVTTLLPDGASPSVLPTVKPTPRAVTKTRKENEEHEEEEERDGGGEVDYGEDFFGKSAFLTVSGQLGAEVYACAMGDVYTFGPTFRAENSNTTRHLAEFWMVEPEMAFAELVDVMNNAEELIKHVISHVVENHDEDITFFSKFVEKGLREKLQNALNEPFARVSYTEAVEVLENAMNQKKVKFAYKPAWGGDLQTEHERYLAETHFQKPVFVYNYPAGIKAFYMKSNDHDDGATVAAMDLLVPGIGELVGGSQREHRLSTLQQKMTALGLDQEPYWWYLDLRRFGSVPHSGYGLGFERLVQFVTGMENIRDVIPFPRHPGNAEF